MKGILALSEEPLVSMDLKGNEHSSIVDTELTMVVGGNLVKVASWYDNEWGYACRVADVAHLIASRVPQGAPALSRGAGQWPCEIPCARRPWTTWTSRASASSSGSTSTSPWKATRITDDTRIRAALPTIRRLIDAQARVVLMSHLGRPDGEVKDDLRLAPVAERLAQLLGRPVATAPDCTGPEAQEAVAPSRKATCCCWRTCASTPRRRPTTPSSPASWPAWGTSTSTTPSAPPTAPTPPPRAWPTSSSRRSPAT